MQKQDGVEVALDYYLQGIRCNNHHFPCVFNLACVYSTLDKHANARKWFNLAIKINPNSIDSYYGSALSSFKMRNFQEAFNVLKNMPSSA
jgi:tetratricopeptide (TPR) repeat protein